MLRVSKRVNCQGTVWHVPKLLLFPGCQPIFKTLDLTWFEHQKHRICRAEILRQETRCIDKVLDTMHISRLLGRKVLAGGRCLSYAIDMVFDLVRKSMPWDTHSWTVFSSSSLETSLQTGIAPRNQWRELFEPKSSQKHWSSRPS